MLLTPRFVPRIWGRWDLRAWYPERGLEAEAIGEAWLTPAECPVLIKMLFPREKLSVQVHPDDAYAGAHGMGRGKSEMWVVLEAEPGARLGVGVRHGATMAEFEAACRAGRGGKWLHWFEAGAGDVIDVPAGTVHAIGPGFVLCEVQQPSDNTFRLDDYGRGRELHLERGFEVARITSGGRVAHGVADGSVGLLLRTEQFEVWRGTGPAAIGGRRWRVNVGASRPEWPRGQAIEVEGDEDHRMMETADVVTVTVA